MDEKLLNPKKLTKKEITISRLKRKFLKHVWLVRIGLFAGIVIAGWLVIVILSFFSSKLGLANYAKILTNFILTPENQIKSISARTNILILGKSGQGHESPDLTDTIMFLSVPHDNSAMMLVSLPRDIWVPSLRAKLNSAYYWGNQKEKGGGIVLAKSVVEEIVGQPLQYAIVIDFSGFKNVIDAIGGIEVNVKNEFTDEKYPIAGKENDNCGGDKEFKCRYETIHFNAGKQFMNGETALKFVRSRNAQGDEGTDLARAARQDLVLQAIKDKVLSTKVLLSPSKINALLKSVKQFVESDIDINSTSVLARKMLQAREKYRSYVLLEEFLINPPISPKYDNLYVFIPKEGNWNKVHEWISQLLNN
ncbi:hypothetical protein A2W13_01470 [Candidatus Woesebacteria bacterium RBG_16_36_11]|uniref:Cell envelope-related transcriptional attenuator domain-containing protein n=3 Tax=Candidatus Woeseibacteriota TaxID=1752722 RepID=A0A1F7XBA8_9BACT|nr:MAG: hypothetical protein A2Z67_03480 [Candidatus Woesebacteria bacterium RBG_13_36_22]OGM12296.1 MAG: hypothetical protein A2W13_01470 [Candidatus Woesebacteria bacterium RBG_16_36_11]OGM16674.1 MAG: hypothetical protein A2V55_01005 [Candidatus Woesebacteria bacterium RBG_19FT_COMBO_37_29]